ncbi:tRNA 2-thiouridine synthesizing protein A [Angulomicrobium tetraedrale]|uniref:tRNA 2-thiouridine synthesizing protein A n=1 Tax=Ancylobacter tetraedralis TaxID=217068 RepID=A0A839ZE24_9HYPH|nr:sulfurtransferase TusA family protein [Ancylobacter tetraedralis]MBB3773009.1 tRNA 2-thiouridine synthesizing protein A [Ancylobacter tetraedralis]
MNESSGERPTLPGDIVRLDLRGLKCPLPALHTGRALERATPGTRLRVECTDPMAVIDIPHLVHQTGHVLEAQETATLPLVFHIRKAGP